MIAIPPRRNHLLLIAKGRLRLRWDRHLSSMLVMLRQASSLTHRAYALDAYRLPANGGGLVGIRPCATQRNEQSRARHRRSTRKHHTSMRRRPQLRAPVACAAVEIPVHPMIAGHRRFEVVRPVRILEAVVLLRIVAG